MPITHLWAIQNKNTINISYENLKKILGKSKVKQHQRRIEGQELKENLDDENNRNSFDFKIERKNRKINLGIDDSKESIREEN